MREGAEESEVHDTESAKRAEIHSGKINIVRIFTVYRYSVRIKAKLRFVAFSKIRSFFECFQG